MKYSRLFAIVLAFTAILGYLSYKTSHANDKVCNEIRMCLHYLDCPVTMQDVRTYEEICR